MSIDFFGTIIFATIAILFMKYDISPKFAAISATILPFLVSKVIIWLPYILLEMPHALNVKPGEIAISALQLPINIIVFYMIAKNDKSISSFGIFTLIAIFLNYMVIPALVPIFLPI